MPKLQRIKRSNGSLVYSVNIPLEIIEQLGWEKGNGLNIEIKEIPDSLGNFFKQLVICKEGEESNG